MRPVNASTLPLALALTPLIGGCGDPFDPQSLLTDHRLLGIVADAPEPAPDQVVTLRAEAWVPEGEVPSHRWSLCLYTLGAATAYACADSSFEFPLAGDGPELRLDLGPAGLDYRRLYARYGPWPGPDGEELTLEDGVPLWVTLETGSPGRVTRAVKRLWVHEVPDSEEAARNRNPEVTELTVDGRSALGASVDVPPDTEVTLALSPADDARQRYVDPISGDARTEELVYRWFAVGGALDPEVTFGDSRSTTFRTPSAAGLVPFFVAVRDGRGGLAIRRGALRVEGTTDPARRSAGND